jgi:hypothetical protein
MSINPYIARIKSFVETVKLNTDISHMRGPYKVGETPPAATWQDKAWQHEDKNGKKANFFFAPNMTRQTRISTIDKHDLLVSPWHELLKAYALHLTTKNLSAANKRNKISLAREIIVDSEFFSNFACDELARYWIKEGGGRNKGLLNDFIGWLKNHKLIPPNTQKLKEDRETKDGTEELQSRQKNLPDEKAIMAMGAIQYEVIPWDSSVWKSMHPLDNQRDAFVCAMFALSMSSPNRVEAEQTVLNLQPLKTMTEIVDGKKKTVHYCDWSGSKGFDDNKNHIVAEMVPVVSLILEYMKVITAANRVLARFYKKPCLPLKYILRDFKVEDANWQAVKPAPEQPINLFALGYLLGFYDRTTIKTVRVKEGTSGAQRENHRCTQKYFSKPIAQLQLGDEVIANANQLCSLLAVRSSNKKLSEDLDFHGVLSVAEIQRRWLAHLKKHFPLFPMVRNHTNDGCCDIEHRLFALNSAQLNLQGNRGGNDYKGSTSPFSVMSPVTMGKVFVNDLSGSGGNNCKTIFERHGFSQEFRIVPHQMRHYMTDTADKSGLPVAVNNMWGGRKDPSQLIHYVHSTDDERAWVISDIFYNEDGKTQEEIKDSIRLVSKSDYDNATGEQGAASVTSSGICTQNLMVTPCQYLNDLNTQCVGCAKSCHVAHDQDAVLMLQKDLTVQEKRLLDVQARPQFYNSDAMQSWFKLHLFNTERLKQLIELMNDPEIAPGNLIRMLIDTAEFRISNLKTKHIEIRKLVLPDTKGVLKRMLEDKQEKDDDIINQLLELF